MSNETVPPVVPTPRAALEILVTAAVAAGMRQPVVALQLALDRYGKSRADGDAAYAATWINSLLLRAPPSLKLGEDEGPTPETMARTRASDPLDALVRSGTVAGDTLAAAMMIRTIREALSRGLGPGTRRFDAVVVDGAPLHRDPIDRMSERMLLLHQHVYLPWAATMAGGVDPEKAAARKGERPVRTVLAGSRRLHLSPFQLVMAVLIDRVSLSRLARRHGVRNGSLTEPFVAALRSFAELHEQAFRDGLLEGEQKGA